MFGRNLLSRLLLATGIKREFDDALQAHSYATISAINTAAADIVSTKMAESNFVTTHELALVSDSIVRDVATSTNSTKVVVDDIADDVTRALDKIKAMTITVDGIERTINNIEGTVDDVQRNVDSMSENNIESLLEEIQESLADIKSLLGNSLHVYNAERKIDSILVWMGNIDQKIDSQHAEIYSALSGGLRVVYDPSLAAQAEKERSQQLFRDLVEAGIAKEDANV